MHLKKLELVGFKSFADRTTLDFKPGVTGIVGPNGCGKSNVVDAFKWILGSQSPKGLRGTEMQDVIFGGTQNRKPLGYAEVTVVFDNTDRYFDIDFTEVAVTRRLFRSGESEYLINKQPCRLKDIKTLFLDTGFGATSYSILEQGKIDVLLQASNSDRRVVFEEAAGISKYRVRKAESLRALLRVEDNLNRLQDLIDEVGKRVRRVKAQASKARRYRAYSDRIRDLRVRIALDAYQGSMVEGSKLSTGLDEVLEKIKVQEEELRRLGGQIEARRGEREQLRSNLQQSRDRVEEERLARERTRGEINHADKRYVELIEEESARKKELQQAAASLERSRLQVHQERSKSGGLQSNLDACRAALSDAKEELRLRRGQVTDLQRLFESRKEGLVEGLQERAATYNLLVETTATLKSLRERKVYYDGVINRQEEALQRCIAGADDLEKKTEESQGALGQVEREREKISQAMETFEVRIEQMEEKLRGMRKELNRDTSRFEALNSLQDSSAVFSRRSGELDGATQVHGKVQSVFRVQDEYAVALEVALGDMNHAVIVEGQEGVFELLNCVRREDGEGAGIISLDRIAPAAPVSFPQADGVLGPLREFVEVEPGFEAIADQLLADVLLVEDVARAFSLSRNGAGNCRIVTPAGELLEPWGGLSAPATGQGGFADGAELDRLSESIQVRDRDCICLEEEIEGLRGKLGKLRLVRGNKGRSADDARRLAMVCEGEIEQAAREVEKLQREIKVNIRERDEVLRDISRKSQVESDHSSEIARLDSECSEAETSIEQLEKELESLREEAESAKDGVSEAKLELGKVEHEEENINEFLQRQERNYEDQKNRCEDLARTISLTKDKILETRNDQVEARCRLMELGDREVELVEELEGKEKREQLLSREEDGLHRQSESVRSVIKEYSDRKEALQLKDQEERHRRDTALDRIEEEYGIDLKSLLEKARDWDEEDEHPGSEPDLGQEQGEAEAGAEDAPDAEEERELTDEERYLRPLPDWNPVAAQDELGELREKMRKLGNVNLEALDELEEIEERYKFQIEQKADLENSEKQFQAIIAELNIKCRQLFQDTFDSVQTNFKELFRKCFGGGRAELVLEEGVDILEAGIDIVARPPGKKLRTLMQMSGGEKTMTTIALLLAIFKSKASPFCILDEVDAPLDDANVRRFTVLLDDFLANTQFIIITHNKVTMGEADTLYGITMEERGVSKRVAVSLESYDPEKMEEMAASGSA